MLGNRSGFQDPQLVKTTNIRGERLTSLKDANDNTNLERSQIAMIVIAPPKTKRPVRASTPYGEPLRRAELTQETFPYSAVSALQKL